MAYVCGTPYTPEAVLRPIMDSIRGSDGRRRARLRDMGIEARQDLPSGKIDRANTLFINVKYRVLYRPGVADDQTTLARIQAQHEMMNMSFNRVNPDVERVPRTGRYGFYDRRGDASIVLLPILGQQVQEEDIERIPISAPFPSIGLSTTVDSFLQTRPNGAIHRYPDVMNIVIAPVAANASGGKTVGEAFIRNNFCVIDNLVVGGYTTIALGLPGNSGYFLGKTGLHEVGHVLGMEHTFAGPCRPQFADIPSQRQPNFTAKLVEKVDGTFDAFDDNMDKACRSGNFGQVCEARCDGTATGEMFQNIMDYNADVRSFFTVQQCQAMRDFLTSEQNILLKLQPAPDEVFDIPAVEVPELNGVRFTVVPEGESSELIPIWAISIVGVVFVLILALLIFRLFTK